MVYYNDSANSFGHKHVLTSSYEPTFVSRNVQNLSLAKAPKVPFELRREKTTFADELAELEQYIVV